MKLPQYKANVFITERCIADVLKMERDPESPIVPIHASTGSRNISARGVHSIGTLDKSIFDLGYQVRTNLQISIIICSGVYL